MVGSVWWMFGYQRLAHSHGWENLIERFARVDLAVLLASALGGCFWSCFLGLSSRP
jgi:hypothetical protein